MTASNRAEITRRRAILGADRGYPCQHSQRSTSWSSAPDSPGCTRCTDCEGWGSRCASSRPADDVGGTWYWNRYPGARVDVPSVDYMYSFDPDWRDGWQWSEKYATQPEILRYLNHVADKFDLRRDIEFGTRVEQARFQDATSVWRVRTDGGEDVSCRFVVMATGCLSIPKEPDIEGVDQFAGEMYFTQSLAP